MSAGGGGSCAALSPRLLGLTGSPGLCPPAPWSLFLSSRSARCKMGRWLGGIYKVCWKESGTLCSGSTWNRPGAAPELSKCRCSFSFLLPSLLLFVCSPLFFLFFEKRSSCIYPSLGSNENFPWFEHLPPACSSETALHV